MKKRKPNHKKNGTVRAIWLITLLLLVVALMAAMALNGSGEAHPWHWWWCWFYKCHRSTPTIDHAATAKAEWGCKCDPGVPGDCENECEP